jgi:transposase
VDYLDITGMKTIGRDPSTNSVRVWAELTTAPGRCPHCPNTLFGLKAHGTKSQTIKDAPMRGRTVEIVIKRRRYRCPVCGRTCLQPFVGVDERWGMTLRLVELVERESLTKPFNQVAQETGVAPSTVRAIFREHIARLEQSVCFETPRVLGLDGVYIRRKERLVLTDIERRRVVQIAASVKERSVAQALFSLPERRRVEVVTLDMSASLRRAVQHALPWAVIVVDRFHIQRMANQAVDRVRRRIHLGMTRYDRRLIMRDPRLLRKHRDQLIKMGKLDVVEEWLDRLPELRAAYDLKEAFFEIWYSSCSLAAWRRYEAWEKSVPEELRCKEAFGPLLTAVENWSDEIFNFFDHRFTNAYTESANNLIKTVQREGRRCDFETVRAKVLYGGALKGVDGSESDSDGDASTHAA